MLLANPLLGGPRECPAAPGVRVLDEPSLVPDPDAATLVSQDDANRRDGPPTAVGPALGLLGGEVHALAVQREGDGLHALSRGVVPEDPPHDRRFLRLDLEPGRGRMLCALTGCLHGDRPVAEDPTSGTQPPGGAAGEPPMVLSRRSSR